MFEFSVPRAVSGVFYKSERRDLHFGRVDKLVVRSNKIYCFPCFQFILRKLGGNDREKF